ncbi:MAG: hypothetical protein HIU84_03145 [Acidobacteria bacterium]|nr:hypothetical protein [Acidobacteriota bacterium]
MMITLGLILLLIGFLLAIHILWIIGLVLLIAGVVIWIMGSMGRTVGGRRHFY